MSSLVSVAKLALCVLVLTLPVNSEAIATDKIISRDVVIVGGGASGSHAAVSLRDLGKSVVVVEKKSTLGGHTETYWDPATEQAINVGVQGWITYQNTTDFVTRMNISTVALAHDTLTTEYVDFSTGEALASYTDPSSTDQLDALLSYLSICEEYEDLILPGYFNFPAADAIPEDLTMLFKDFVAKYNISAAVPTLFELTGLGVGDIMNTVTMYVMQAIGAPMIRLYAGGASSIVPASGDVHELYDRVADFLGDNVLYNSTVVSSKRNANDEGVTLVVQNSQGETTTIEAKRLLMAIEPTVENMAPFDLDAQEAAVFSKFQHSNVYVGAVRSPSFPINYTYYNLPATAEPSNWTVFPLPSFNSRFSYFGSNTDLYRFLMVGNADLDAAGAHQLAVDGFENMVQSGVLAATNTTLEFAAFEDHGAMHLRVNSSELQAGFIQDQYALQGRRSTWWTGAAWSAQFTTVVWGFNNQLLPMMVADME